MASSMFSNSTKQKVFLISQRCSSRQKEQGEAAEGGELSKEKADGLLNLAALQQQLLFPNYFVRQPYGKVYAHNATPGEAG